MGYLTESMNFYFHSTEIHFWAKSTGYRATIALICSKRATDALPIVQDGLPMGYHIQWDIKLGSFQ